VREDFGEFTDAYGEAYCDWDSAEKVNWYQVELVSDIAIFVLKRDVKLQLTNYQVEQC